MRPYVTPPYATANLMFAWAMSRHTWPRRRLRPNRHRYLERHDIRMYRLPITLAPYASHPELTQFHSQIEECASELAEVGALARERDVRLSAHPGQYTVLNSERVEVRAAAVAELESQAALLDAMGLGEEAVVVLQEL